MTVQQGLASSAPAALTHRLLLLLLYCVTTHSYGDVTPITSAEVLFTIVYVAINIVVWAYVLGTITLLVTKQVWAVARSVNCSLLVAPCVRRPAACALMCLMCRTVHLSCAG
jgi:hypothetical protein